jgi:superfamily II DNA/RNA helicase
VISRGDYELQAVARVEGLLENRAFERDRRRLSAEDLLREVNPEEREILQTLTPERRQALKAGAYLLRATALGLSRGHERRRDYLRVAAEMFEDLAGHAQEQEDRRTSFQALSQAAACWSLAGYQANAVVMGDRLRRAFPEFDHLSPAGEVGAPGSLDFYAVAAGVIERNLARLEQLVGLREAFLADVETAALAAADQADAGLGTAELIELIALAELLRGVGDALMFWRSGDERAAARAEERFAEAERLTLAGETPESWLVVSSAREIFADSARRSTWRTFRRHVESWNPLWTRYLRQLAAQQRAVVELWPSQRMALEAGLLDPARRALVVRTPTSSGKTRMAEAAIVDAISKEPDGGCCVYVVPFRALATEVEAGLGATLGDLGIRVSSLFGGYETSELEDFLLSSSNVLILTPEKLDLVLRSDPDFAERLRLIVVDEGQLLGGENARAIRLALLLTRLRRSAPDARTLFLSAVVPNVDQVARWLDPDGLGAFDQPWRPTRLLTGVFRWAGDRGRIDYEGQTEFFVPYVLRRETRSLGLTPVRRQPTTPRPWPTSVAESAAELALHFQRIGPVVVFAAQPRNCAAVCKALEIGLRLRAEGGGLSDVIAEGHQAEVDELVALAAKHLGAGHELVGWLRLGIAYHHARVPEALRVRIEDAFRSGALQVLACTATLSQGVNLPVKTLIVSHTRRGQDDTISVRDFWNVAGRAGRANRETRGQVILIESPTASEARRQRSYLDPGNIEPLQSRLLDLLVWLAQQRCSTATLTRIEDVASMTQNDEIDGELGDLLDDDDVIELEAQVLALLCEEVVDTEDIEMAEALLRDSLAGVQLADLRGPTRPFARFLSARARAAAEAVPDVERRMRYYRTGLSVGSCVALDALADELVEEFGERLWNLGADREIQDRMVAGAFGVGETPPAEDVPVELAVEIVADWIGYATMEELRARYSARAPQLADPTTLNLFIQASFANGAPWPLSALLSFLEVRIPEGQSITEDLRTLPALVKFGVDSPQAAYASTLAAQDRDTARKLAEMASRAGVAEGFTAFMSWMSELRIEELRLGLGAGPETDRLARRVARLSTSNLALELVLGRSSVVVSVRGLAYSNRADNARALDLGARVVLAREHDNAYDANAIQVLLADGRPVGYVAREAARGLAGRLDEDPDSFIASVREIDLAVPMLGPSAF